MWAYLTSLDDLRTCFSQQEGEMGVNLILKHSTRCSLSSMVKSRLEKSPDNRINYFIIDVIAHRAVSNLLAELSEVRHESPQAFLINQGKLLEVKSHLSINSAEFSRRIDTLKKIESL